MWFSVSTFPHSSSRNPSPRAETPSELELSRVPWLESYTWSVWSRTITSIRQSQTHSSTDNAGHSSGSKAERELLELQ